MARTEEGDADREASRKREADPGAPAVSRGLAAQRNLSVLGGPPNPDSLPLTLPVPGDAGAVPKWETHPLGRKGSPGSVSAVGASEMSGSGPTCRHTTHVLPLGRGPVGWGSHRNLERLERKGVFARVLCGLLLPQSSRRWGWGGVGGSAWIRAEASPAPPAGRGWRLRWQARCPLALTCQAGHVWQGHPCQGRFCSSSWFGAQRLPSWPGKGPTEAAPLWGKQGRICCK